MLSSNGQRSLLARVLVATAIVPIPPIIFEKYTYHLYAIASPTFFTYSGYRLWFDIIWFCFAGIVSVLIVGRKTKASVVPPLLGSLILTLVVYVAPLCTMRECYISSTDGLAPVRDYLLFASLAVITAAASMKDLRGTKNGLLLDDMFQLGVPTLMGYALSFFPIMHIFAGVSVPYPGNYFQWFMSGAPAGLACSMWMLDRGRLTQATAKLFSGVSGVALAIMLALELPCTDCSGYFVAVPSILLLAAAFSIPAAYFGKARQKSARSLKAPKIITTSTIVITILILWIFFLGANYEMSVVNGFAGVTNSSFSPVEVGSTFVYSGGYLAIPRVTSPSVGVNVSFQNTTISGGQYPNDFLAAGVGDQSPNCCKDGLDLVYRADAVEFSNGTEAVLARAWWACDVIVACGGYSWQHLLFLGSEHLPEGTLSNWVELEMNWTLGDVHWYYRIHNENASASPWVLYSAFKPPKIENHYWNAGMLYTGEGNHPVDYAYFYQFGVSSAYPIKGGWKVLVECPNIVLNGSRECIPAANYVNGAHSFWKVLYTFGKTYRGMNFSYLGNYEVEFYYDGVSPNDGTVIW